MHCFKVCSPFKKTRFLKRGIQLYGLKSTLAITVKQQQQNGGCSIVSCQPTIPFVHKARAKAFAITTSVARYKLINLKLLDGDYNE